MTHQSTDERNVDTGHAEADRVLGRLASSDPDFDDCTDAAVLIRRLVADMRGPDDYATWREAAVAERLRRLQAVHERDCAVEDVARLLNDIQELTCGDPRKVCPNCREQSQDDVPDAESVSTHGPTP